MASINEQMLDERLAQVEKARSWSPRLVSKLESHIRQADDEGLFRINPMSFASERHLEPDEVIDLFLHASAAGLFTMDWLLLCPPCSCVVESFRTIATVHNHYRCNVCFADYEAELDDLIAVAFTVAPAIRNIRFHHPEELSPADYMFKYHGTTDGRLPDGTPFTEVKRQFCKVIEHLPPSQTTRLEIEVSEGTLLGASAEGPGALLYAIEGPPASELQTIDVSFGGQIREQEKGQARSGRVAVIVENGTDARGTYVLALLPPGVDPGNVPVTFVPYLTGKKVLTTQAFRDLFRSEVMRGNEGLKVREVALLFTDLKGSTALYDRIGDLNAFALVQQHFDRLQHVTVRHGGAVIKTIGDAVMAAFLDPLAAVRAAIAMRAEIASFNGEASDRQLILKIGLHTGAAIAVTLNDRLDYFGQTVNIASRVQNLADADEIYVSEDVHAAKEVEAALASFPVDQRMASLKGIHQDMRVYRIAPSLAAG